MEPEKINLIFPEGKDKAEVIIREVNEVVEDKLPVLEPDQVSIDGNITAPFSFLEKRWGAEDNQIDHSRTYLYVERDKLAMHLICNETDKRNRKDVFGRIVLSRQFKAFSINGREDWTPMELGDFFRINRTYFETKEENMNLVALLKGFSAKVSTDIEKYHDNSGSTTDVYRKVVDSNLPKSFYINIPIFKGTAPEKIEVEIVARVSGRDVYLQLISADAASIEEEVRDKLIDAELDKVRELAPEIPIIEA